MFRRRRGTLVKLILAVVLFWTGTLLYLAYHNRQREEADRLSDAEDPLGLGKQLRPRPNRGAEGGIHTARHPILEPLDMDRLNGNRDDGDAERKRQMQVQWEQRQLEALLAGKANYSNVRGVSAADAVMHVGNDVVLETDVDSLVRKGLIVPKWNIDREVPEDPGAPGENGQAIQINKKALSEDERRKYDIGWQANAFNEYASSSMSVHRTLPDARDHECRELKYRQDLPDTSVIIIFHNEAWKALLRTVHSVLDRSPPHLIKEIILVDDFSSHDHLKQQLVDYMAQLGKVKILRAKKREGLIRARLMGAAAATGQVLTYLDSHCECTLGWLEPLLDRIAENKSNVVTPVIDVVDDTTLQYKFGSARSTNLGGFDWSLQFNWHAIPERVLKNRKSEVEPLESPTMAGGLFSISREYFEYLGSYDPGMEIWGGENLEMSFRVWMCGGRLEIVLCSHVGHIFRSRSPYTWSVSNALRKNSVRLALVWMDDFSKYYFDKTGYNLGEYGDITPRKKLREKLQCKSFDWFLENIYPELFIPGESLAAGQIRSKVENSGGKSVCVDAAANRPQDNPKIGVAKCYSGAANQNWFLSKTGEVRRDEGCFDYAGQYAMIYSCHGMQGNQLWSYNMDNTVQQKSTNLCLTLSKDMTALQMEPCIGTDHQIWHWERRTPDSDQKRRGLQAMPLPR